MRRTIKVLPMPDRIKICMNVWGQKTQTKEFGNTMVFRDRKKKQFAWDNEDLETVGLVEDQMAHREIPAEIPGVTL